MTEVKAAEDIDAFLQALAKPGVNSVHIPVNTALDWLAENQINARDLREKATQHGLLCQFIMKDIRGQSFNFLELRKDTP